MSKGARRKRQTRPWQNADAMRDISHLLGASSSTVATDLEMDGYEVSEVPEHKADKDYICPDCGNVIPQGEAHVVVFPDGRPGSAAPLAPPLLAPRGASLRRPLGGRLDCRVPSPW